MVRQIFQVKEKKSKITGTVFGRWGGAAFAKWKTRRRKTRRRQLSNGRSAKCDERAFHLASCSASATGSAGSFTRHQRQISSGSQKSNNVTTCRLNIHFILRNALRNSTSSITKMLSFKLIHSLKARPLSIKVSLKGQNEVISMLNKRLG